MDTIKLKRATKSVANASTKVLEKDEVLVITPDSGSGKGKCQLKFGDGVTATKSLPIAIDGENADETKVSTIPTISDENPVLSAGETVKVFFGKIKKKFTYLENLLGNVKTVTNLFGSNDAKTVAQGLQNLVNTKFNKSDLYDGTDSTSKSLGATANAVRKVNEKTDNNTSSISQLNSNLANKNIIGTYNIPNITGVSTSPKNIAGGYHNVAKYSNGQCMYSALVYVYTSAISNSVIGTISSQYAPKQDISAYVYDFAGKRFLMILISPDGTIKLLTLEGTAIPESAVKVRGSIVF